MSELEDIWHRTPEERHSDEKASLGAEITRLRDEVERLKALYEHAVATQVYYAEQRNNECARREAAERKLAATLARAP